MTPDTGTRSEQGLFLRITIWFSSTRVGQLIYVRVIPPIDRWLMLRSHGRWSLSPKGAPEGIGGLALLTTVGAKSGKPRHTPLGFARDGDLIVLVASNAARARPPAWYFNLKSNPAVTITPARCRRGSYHAAEIPAGPERDRLWKLACAMNPGFERYPPRTGGRLIPVIHCTPVGQS